MLFTAMLMGVAVAVGLYFFIITAMVIGIVLSIAFDLWTRYWT